MNGARLMLSPHNFGVMNKSSKSLVGALAIAAGVFSGAELSEGAGVRWGQILTYDIGRLREIVVKNEERKHFMEGLVRNDHVTKLAGSVSSV